MPEPPLDPMASRVRDEIQAAWASEPHPGRIPPHCERPDCPAIAEYFSRQTWRSVRFADMRAAAGSSWDGPMHFLTPAAFRYFLPAFLTMYLEQPRRIDVLAQTIVRSVCPHEGWRPFVEGLSGDQKRAVLSFLRFVEATGDTSPEVPAGLEFWTRAVARGDCTFCRILRGDLPRTLVDEAEHCIVILDRNQAARGHLLVVPKRHVTLWHELDAPAAIEMGAKAHLWAGVLVEALRPDGYNVLINGGAAAGQDVPHAHLHVVPRAQGDGYYRFGGRSLVLTDDDARALGEHLQQVFFRGARPGR